MVHNFGPNAGRRGRGPADRRRPARARADAVDLPVGEDQPVVFNHTFAAPGDHLVEVQIDDDPLKLDNRRWLAVPVREHLNVLLVDGHFKTEPFQAETDYLAAGPEPRVDVGRVAVGDPDRGRLRVAARRAATWPRYDAVVLCNIAQFTEAEVSALDDYLKQGGGVVVFGGDQVVADNYNRLLFADGKGLLPASIGPSVGDAAEEGGVVRASTRSASSTRSSSRSPASPTRSWRA